VSAGARSFGRALARDAPLTAVALGRALRAAGLPVTPGRSGTFAAAAGLLEARAGFDRGSSPAAQARAPLARDALYWAARLSFVSSRDQLAAFDAVFAAVVDGLADPAGDVRGDRGAPPLPDVVPRGAEPAGAGGSSAAGDDGVRRPSEPELVVVGVHASAAERLSGARLEELDEAEFALVAQLIRRLAVATPPRRARRSRTSPHGEHLDVRATLRRSRRTAGDPVAQLHRRRRERPRPLVALLDVSGSMAPYARAYVLLLEGAARGARAETFVFATRLTRVTRLLREGRAHAALERASAAAPDWAGGTRLGEALRTFNDRFGRRGMARDAVVVVLSDGWERGDPALVGREMERLARLAYRIVWVNPRVAAPGFAPATGGMAAALPHVDELISGHSAAALDSVVDAIRRHR
jgi:uncharacterized protein with von Willebrand factor type A (vWA) domain